MATGEFSITVTRIPQSQDATQTDQFRYTEKKGYLSIQRICQQPSCPAKPLIFPVYDSIADGQWKTIIENPETWRFVCAIALIPNELLETRIYIQPTEYICQIDLKEKLTIKTESIEDSQNEEIDNDCWLIFPNKTKLQYSILQEFMRFFLQKTPIIFLEQKHKQLLLRRHNAFMIFAFSSTTTTTLGIIIGLHLLGAAFVFSNPFTIAAAACALIAFFSFAVLLRTQFEVEDSQKNLHRPVNPTLSENSLFHLFSPKEAATKRQKKLLNTGSIPFLKNNGNTRKHHRCTN